MRNEAASRAAADIAKDWIAQLPPSSFALVMATGIVSIASELLGLHWIAVPLLVVNLIAFGVLWLMIALRVLIFPTSLLDDLRAHARGPGFFTIVAGTSVVGVQVFVLMDQADLAATLWLLALCLWVLITYSLFTVIIAQPEKPSLVEGFSGVWLIASVATQSIAVLGAVIASHFPEYEQAILFLCLLFFCMGCMLYVNIIALIFYRLTFLPLNPNGFTPPYWINMGATAIATQAGASLLIYAEGSPLLSEVAPFVKGFTLFFWAAGTWWIPLLVVLWVWTIWRNRAVTYTPLYWAAVFPLGMYTACTYQLAIAAELEGLLWLPEFTVYVALLAWGITFIGFLRRLIRALDAAGRGVFAPHHS